MKISMILKVLVISVFLLFPNTSYSQCLVLDDDKISIDGKEYSYFSEARTAKMAKDLKQLPLYKERVEMLEIKNRQNEAIIKFYQAQVDVLINKKDPVVVNNDNSIYPVIGAYVLGNVSSAILFGYWSKTSK